MAQGAFKRESPLTIPLNSSWALQYKALEERLETRALPFFQATRKKAFQRFQELGFPTTKQEEWKYTNLSHLAKIPFQSCSQVRTVTSGITLEDSTLSHLIKHLGQQRLVFLNGRFSPELSSPPTLSRAITICPMKDLLLGNSSPSDTNFIFEKYFSRYAGYDEHSFVALNTAFVSDGALVRITKGTVLADPLLLVFLTTNESIPVVSHPRVLVVAEENSQASIFEIYAGLGEETYFSNSVTELIVAENSLLNHCKLELETEHAFHIGSTSVHQEAKSYFTSHVFSFGGRLVRNELRPLLQGEGVETALYGLTILGANQHVDNTTVIDHAKPHGHSDELYKGIYGDKARGVFSGTIIVRPHAQKTNAIQSNKSILLSADAIVDSRPQLKIWADDVRCTHGATVGQLDEHALFYLRSRGIAEKQARKMLIEAFVKEVITTVKSEILQQELAKLVDGKLSTLF